MENIWVSAYGRYDHYLWENGELKREPVEDDAREAASTHSDGNVFRTYGRRFHEPRDVQRLVEEVADAWFKKVGSSSSWEIPEASRKKTNWARNWSKKEKEAKRIFITTFTQVYNQLVREKDAADEAKRRREEAARRQMEQEAEARRRAEQLRSQQQQPVYTPPPQPVVKQEEPKQQPETSTMGPKATIIRVDRSRPNAYVYYMQIVDPGYIEGTYEPEPLTIYFEGANVPDTTETTPTTYGSSGTSVRTQAGGNVYPPLTKGKSQQPRKPSGSSWGKPR